jgi:hypothetical protein
MAEYHAELALTLNSKPHIFELKASSDENSNDLQWYDENLNYEIRGVDGSISRWKNSSPDGMAHALNDGS